jgi:hypothetical protein
MYVRGTSTTVKNTWPISPKIGKLDRVQTTPRPRGRPPGPGRHARQGIDWKECAPPPGGCGIEKPLAEFYVTRSGAARSLCKECHLREERANRQVRVGRAVFVGELRVLVRIQPPKPEPPSHAPPPRHWPRYGSTPLCSRGEHPWPIETACRGYEVLGCGGWEPHVHRKCLAHACEEIEGMPRRLR